MSELKPDRYYLQFSGCGWQVRDRWTQRMVAIRESLSAAQRVRRELLAGALKEPTP